MTAQHLCPACGFDLWFAPWNEGAPSYEICPSCGIQFGYDDAAGGRESERAAIYTSWRARWTQDGMPWFSAGQRPPADWNPAKSLERLLGQPRTG
jgi:hypothetical protein